LRASSSSLLEQRKPEGGGAFPMQTRILKPMLHTFFILLLIYALVVGFFALLQNRLIYFPSRRMIAPEDAGLEKVEQIQFLTSDGIRLSGWYLSPPSQAPVLLNFNGNAGNLAGRAHLMEMARQNGWGMLLFDYRGYGGSAGTPSEAGLYRDSRGALDWLRVQKAVDQSRICYYGQSLGSAVALELAAADPPAALILEAPFTSMKNLARELYPWLPVSLFLRNRFDNLESLRRVYCPKLIVHGRQDEVVPFRHGKTLFEMAPEPKQFLELNTHHNDIFENGGPPYWKALRDFVNRAAAPVNSAPAKPEDPTTK